MDPLAATAIGLVAPYLAKGAEAFASAAGGEVFAQVKKLADRLKTWWSRDPVTNAAAENLSKDPKRNAKTLSERLSEDLQNDPSFARELSELVDKLGPNISVVQNIEVAHGVTGADIDEFLSGSVHVEQDMKEATGVVGFKSKKVGR